MKPTKFSSILQSLGAGGASLRFNRSSRLKLGRRICRRREELGLTQRGLAELADVSSQRQVWAIEHGLTGVTVETARRVAQALGWSLSQLFKGL